MGQKVDIKGLHKHLGGVVSEWTLRQKAKKGMIPGCVRVGARYVFDLEIITEWFRNSGEWPGGEIKIPQVGRPAAAE